MTTHETSFFLWLNFQKPLYFLLYTDFQIYKKLPINIQKCISLSSFNSFVKIPPCYDAYKLKTG